MTTLSADAPRTSRFRQIRERIAHLLWHAEDLGPLGQGLRVVGITLWKFFAVDRGFLRASALTYTTLLSLVPLLALMFAVLSGLGVQRRLEPLLLEHIAMGNEEVVRQIIEYVDRTKIGALGALGLVTLLFTAVSVLSNIEMSFNDIWQVQRGRQMFRKVADYIAMLVVGPVLLLASLSAATMLKTSVASETLALVGPAVNLILHSTPYISIWVALALMYLIMPNRRVPFSAAMLGGVIAGTLWKFAQGAYIYFQFGMAKYNAIYGALAQLPMLLVWVYLSWCIVLLGAELAFVYQLPGRGRFLRFRGELWVPRLDVALAILRCVARRFEGGEKPVSAPEVLLEVGLHPGQGDDIIARLVAEGLITWTQTEPPCLVPARSPERTTVSELVGRVQRLPPAAEVDASPPGLSTLLDSGGGKGTWAELAGRGEP